jgi:hypothetical protein
MWAQMPDLMICNAAERLALRRAFPAEVSAVEGEDAPAGAAVAYVDAGTGEVFNPNSATQGERNEILEIARALPPEVQEAFVSWMAENHVPPISHPDLTSEQALLAKAYLANLDEPSTAA